MGTVKSFLFGYKVGGKKSVLKEFEFSFLLPFLCPFFSLSFLPSLTAKMPGYSFDGVDT